MTDSVMVMEVFTVHNVVIERYGGFAGVRELGLLSSWLRGNAVESSANSFTVEFGYS